MAHRPQLEGDARGVVRGRLHAPGCDAPQGIADVPRSAAGVDVAHAREEVEVRRAGSYPELDSYRTDRLDCLPQRRGRVGEHVGPALERAVVDHRLAGEQNGSTE